eukprot:CAMPEP_0174707916 /NCGR_PEP_ID=MMETSP1094-20130205/10303_1 /TAXON_ID=156173 /ORGANISM="Chrysochromulina brevifilum, Strain UTEX LB 985" /LENGTH=149 /DNA_ID=CAMNT_0015906385 /DNA_START=77 /DNA_END=528 /DNA_ORIENTATION=-
MGNVHAPLANKGRTKPSSLTIVRRCPTVREAKRRSAGGAKSRPLPSLEHKVLHRELADIQKNRPRHQVEPLFSLHLTFSAGPPSKSIGGDHQLTEKGHEDEACLDDASKDRTEQPVDDLASPPSDALSISALQSLATRRGWRLVVANAR